MITAPRWQKVLADLWGSRVRSLLVVASIAVGLFAIGIIATIYIVIAGDMRTGYTAVNAANIYIQADSLDQDIVEHLGRVDGVEQAEGVRTIDLRIRDRDNEWQSLHLQAVHNWSTSTSCLISKQRSATCCASKCRMEKPVNYAWRAWFRI
jgi:putative ABC transport system permease protein